MLGVRLGPLRVVVRPVQGSHPLMGSRGQLMCERRLIWRVAPTAPLPTRTECVVARRDRTLAAWHPSGVVDPVNTRTCQTVTNTLPTLFRTACPASPRVHPS